MHGDEYGRKRGAYRSERRERLHAPTAGEDAGAHWSAPGGVEDNYLPVLSVRAYRLMCAGERVGDWSAFFLPLFDVDMLECSVGDLRFGL